MPVSTHLGSTGICFTFDSRLSIIRTMKRAMRENNTLLGGYDGEFHVVIKKQIIYT